MDISNPTFIILAATGAVFIVMGLIMLKNPPKNINDWYGYRTASSKKSQERWDFAQKHSSKRMTKVGQLLAILSFPAAVFHIDPMSGAIIAIIVVVGAGTYLVITTERALREKFGN